MTKIALFADVQNIYYTTRHAYQRQFNYQALWQQVCAMGDIVEAYAYAIDRGDRQQIKFQNALKEIGFTIKLKPYIQRQDGSAKGDWDVGITLDVIDAASRVDQVVLLSGDGDFDLLLKRVAESGVSSHVYGVPALTANALVNAASHYHPIDETLLL